MKLSPLFAVAISLFFLSFATSLRALELNPLFSDNAVLQQEMPVPVWGTAQVGEEIKVVFAGQEKSTKAGSDGSWMVVLDPLVASAKPAELVVSSGSTSITSKGILIGEVWIGSGQSNMGLTVERAFQAEATAKAADNGEYAGVRLFKVPVEGSDIPMKAVEAVWDLPSAATVSRFSATAFFFAAQLAKDRSVPVGIIQSANGGTNAFSWVNSATLESDPAAETIRGYWSAALQSYPAAMERYKATLAKWRANAAEAKKAGTVLEEKAPKEPIGPDHVKRPGGHYNAMIAPLQPLAMRGVIWYQGEANSRAPFNVGYRDLMFALVEDWREDWAAEAAAGGAETIGRSDFPFYLVQLPNFGGGDPEGWPIIREQMLKFWQEGENTGMVVAIDKGEAGDIHPRDKQPIGERLARFARANAYGENIVYSGPIFESLRIEGDEAIVSFTQNGSGLSSLDGKPLTHFEVAGADGKYVPAKASIAGETVVVKADGITAPRAVRYAWSANPEGINFGNKEGLPASPFRTDSW
jgi:sialate O-acetylesterase